MLLSGKKFRPFYFENFLTIKAIGSQMQRMWTIIRQKFYSFEKLSALSITL